MTQLISTDHGVPVTHLFLSSLGDLFLSAVNGRKHYDLIFGCHNYFSSVAAEHVFKTPEMLTAKLNLQVIVT